MKYLLGSHVFCSHGTADTVTARAYHVRYNEVATHCMELVLFLLGQHLWLRITHSLPGGKVHDHIRRIAWYRYYRHVGDAYLAYLNLPTSGCVLYNEA